MELARDHTFTPAARAEEALRRLGFAHLRVCHHGEIARIEVPEPDLYQVVAFRARIVEAVQRAGYEYVTLDLSGYGDR